MDRLTWEVLTEVQGRLEAELLESYLEAHGVDVELIQEAIGHTVFPVTVNGLGRVQVFVPKKEMREAREWLRQLEKGSDTKRD